MDVVVFFIFLEDDVGIAIVELAQELGFLSDRLKLLYSVDLNVISTGLGKKHLSFSLKEFYLLV